MQLGNPTIGRDSIVERTVFLSSQSFASTFTTLARQTPDRPHNKLDEFGSDLLARDLTVSRGLYNGLMSDHLSRLFRKYFRGEGLPKIIDTIEMRLQQIPHENLAWIALTRGIDIYAGILAPHLTFDGVKEKFFQNGEIEKTDTDAIVITLAIAQKTIELRKKRGVDEYKYSDNRRFFDLLARFYHRELDANKKYIKQLHRKSKSSLEKFLESLIKQVELSPMLHHEVHVLKNMHAAGHEPAAEAAKNLDPSLLIEIAREFDFDELVNDDSYSSHMSTVAQNLSRALAKFKEDNNFAHFDNLHTPETRVDFGEFMKSLNGNTEKRREVKNRLIPNYVFQSLQILREFENQKVIDAFENELKEFATRYHFIASGET